MQGRVRGPYQQCVALSRAARISLHYLDLMEPVDVYSMWLDACEEVNPPEEGTDAHKR